MDNKSTQNRLEKISISIMTDWAIIEQIECMNCAVNQCNSSYVIVVM